MTLAELLKKRREALEMTLDEVADAAGISKSSLWESENVRNLRISLINATRISVALGIHINLMAAAALEAAAIDAALAAQNGETES